MLGFACPLACVLAVTFLSLAQTAEPAATPSEDKRDRALYPRVKLETSLGDVVLELNGEKAPLSVDNFLTYVEDGHYNGLIFHRVMPDFMIQGGGYDADMNERREKLRAGVKNEWQNGLKNVRGSIAMARLGGQPDSATAQFFINVVDNASLDMPRDGAAYAVFGKVVEGLDVVDKIRNTETVENPKLPMGKVVPKEPVVIRKAGTIGSVDRERVKRRVAEMEEEAMAAIRKQREEWEKGIAETIQKVETDTGKKVQRTPKGALYVVLTDGTGATPKPTDRVEVHYTGTLTNGEVFDSSRERGPAVFGLNQVISGWTEGVGLMKVGEKRKYIFPPDMAYGTRGAGGKIPPNATLIFEIELLGIK